MKTPGLIPRPVATGIAIVITLVWAGNLLASVFVPTYETNDTINTAFMLLAGGIFALGKGRDTDADDGDDPSSDQASGQRALPDDTPPAGVVSVHELQRRLKAERGDQ